MLQSFVKTSSHLFQQLSFQDIQAILQPQGYWLHRLQPQHKYSWQKLKSLLIYRDKVTEFEIYHKLNV